MGTPWNLFLFYNEACHSQYEINPIFIVHDCFETLSLLAFLFCAETATNKQECYRERCHIKPVDGSSSSVSV